MRLNYLQNSDDSPYKLVLSTASHIPLLLSLILCTLSNTLCPPMLSQWFLTDIIRRTTETVRSTFDYCLTPPCSTTSVKRARSLSRVVASAAALTSLSIGLEGALTDKVYRLLLYRLQEGPRTGWENVDNALRDAFDAKLGVIHPRQNILVALDVLRTETWGDEGKELRVGLSILSSF